MPIGLALSDSEDYFRHVTVVVSDSTCDLHPGTARKLGIEILPLNIHLQGETQKDWQEIEPGALYDLMRAGEVPTTTPVSAAAFEVAYRRLLQQHEQIVSLHISGVLSKTVEHARQAAAALHAEERIHVIDSGMASLALAELVLVAQQVLDLGADHQDMIRAVTETTAEIKTEISVASLEHLRRAGRMGRAQKLAADVMGLRPVLTFADGEVVHLRNVHAEYLAEDMLEHLRQHFGNEPLSFAIGMASLDVPRLQSLQQAVTRSGLNVAQGRVQLVGAAISVHTGPDAFGFTARPME